VGETEKLFIKTRCCIETFHRKVVWAFCVVAQAFAAGTMAFVNIDHKMAMVKKLAAIFLAAPGR
jgi:hypothetical protein